MASSPILALLLLTVITYLGSPLLVIAATGSDPDRPEFLEVPSTEFVGSVRSTMGAVRDVVSVLLGFAGSFGDFRLSNAVNDCLDLLDLSDDELGWTLSASQSPSGKDSGTGHVSADMMTWLGGALGNQDTCVDGFDGTNGIVKSLVAGGLDQVTSLVRDLLGMVRSVPNTAGFPRGRKSSGPSSDQSHDFPRWLEPRDRRLLQSNGNGGGPYYDVVVAADGSGNFTRIADAVSAAPDGSPQRFVIYVKKGVYNEYVEIGKTKTNLMLIGDGMDVTVVSGNRNYVDGWTTYRSATFAVKGARFIARDMTFENTAGPQKQQAVAYRSDSDLSVVYRCAIRGYQDTLYAHSMRQFFRDCTITGTVDFIFGNAAAVFQNCWISARIGLPNQKNTVTAQGRKEPTQPSGFCIHLSNVSAEPNPSSPNSTAPTYLGRPWKAYSRAIFMQSYLSGAVRPEGWLEWDGNFALDTLFYAEFMNYGPGAGLGGRVKWPGYHALNDSAVANTFTVAEFILGNYWLPQTGVKYTAGLVA